MDTFLQLFPLICVCVLFIKKITKKKIYTLSLSIYILRSAAVTLATLWNNAEAGWWTPALLKDSFRPWDLQPRAYLVDGSSPFMVISPLFSATWDPVPDLSYSQGFHQAFRAPSLPAGTVHICRQYYRDFIPNSTVPIMSSWSGRPSLYFYECLILIYFAFAFKVALPAKDKPPF